MYTKTLLAGAVLFSIPSLFLVIAGVFNANWTHVVFWGGTIFVWWAGYLNVKKGGKWAVEGSVLFIFCFWVLMLLLTIHRIGFIFENGGMERADGYGSPLAFLIGFAGEQIFFIPLTVALFFGIRQLIRLRLRLSS